MENKTISYLEKGIVNLTDTETEKFKREILGLTFEDGIELLLSIVDNQYKLNLYQNDYDNRKVTLFLNDIRFQKYIKELLRRYKI